MLLPVQILRSPPGTRFTYWTGYSLTAARLEDEQLDMLATWLFHANAAGYVWLLQRRMNNGEFAFEAVRSSLPLTPAQEQLLVDGTGELRHYGRPHADVDLAGGFLLGEPNKANGVVVWAAYLACGGKVDHCRNYDRWRLECPGGGDRVAGPRVHRRRLHVASGAKKKRPKKSEAA